MGDRLLEPEHVGLLESMADPDGRVGVVGLVGVHGKEDVRALIEVRTAATFRTSSRGVSPPTFILIPRKP